MIKSSIELMAYDIGKDIGHSDDRTQGKLLNGFFHALGQIQNSNNTDTQICYIVDQLDPTAKKLVVRLAEFCDAEGKG